MKLWQVIIISVIFLGGFQNCNSQSEHADKDIYKNSDNVKQSELSIDEINESITQNRHNAITKAVKSAENAIVGINVTEVRQVQYRNQFRDPFFEFFFGERSPRYREYEVQGLGSGFIISPDGYILTNHHVAGNASEVVVTMTDGTKHDAVIVGSDLTTDVALLKINAKDLPYLKMGDSEDIIIGEWAIAFGNPFGLFDLNAKPTVTVGVVSNNGVNFTQEGRVYKDMIQTDAAISSGNSGGPLLNALGEVIGMNTVIFSTAQSRTGAGSIGIGWAIPVNRVKEVVDILKTDKRINRNFDIGVEVADLDEDLARYLRVEKRPGVVVVAVDTRKTAGRAGIEPGDIIININGNNISNESDYYIFVNDNKVGDELKIRFLRDNNEMSTSFKLSEQGFRRGRR